MKGKKHKPKKGITIQFLTLCAVVTTAIVFVFVIKILTVTKNRFDSQEVAFNKFVICAKNCEIIKESLTDLTELARLFVITRKDEYSVAYLKEAFESKKSIKALEAIETVYSARELPVQRLKSVIDQSTTLMEMELYAIRLLYMALERKDLPKHIEQINLKPGDTKLSKKELEEKSYQILFGNGYVIQKKRTINNCDLTINSIQTQLQKELANKSVQLGENIKKLRFLFFLLFIVNFIIFIFFALFIIFPLRKFKDSIEKDDKLDTIGAAELKQLAERYNEIYNLKAKREKSLLKQAEYDELTGILNRRAFSQVCDNSAQDKLPVALLLIDMDNFKNVNDSYGHSGGDTALKELAKILRETFRSNDFIARIGGDEFAAILPSCSISASEGIKHKISIVNKRLANIKDGIKHVSVSVGVAFSENGYNEELFKQADTALYAVKENGKHGCTIYSEEIKSSISPESQTKL